MKFRKTKALKILVQASISFCVASSLIAEEKIIKQENMSFEKCLTVITTSEDKLSIAPEISKKEDQIRIAVFTLIDGTLTILCDGQKGLVTVSTKTN